MGMEVLEYSYQNLMKTISTLNPMYDIVRIVDPEECRTLQFDTDGKVHTGNECFNVWESSHRCSNCSSLKACRTSQKYQKYEIYQNQKYDVRSVPILVDLAGNTKISCVMELITANEIKDSDRDLAIKQNENEDYLLMHDELTGLFNYDGFIRAARAKIAAKKNSKCVIGILDIRNFSLLNTQFGRQKGNEILTEISKVMTAYQKEGYIAGRIYADRFAFCIEEEQFKPQNLLNDLDALNNHIDTGIYRLVFHIGANLVEDSGVPMAVLIDSALIALRGTHDQGSNNCTWYDDGMLAQIIHEQKVISAFEQNLEAGNFHIFLQPQVNEEGKLKGAEVLARWIMPDGAVLPPAAFIDVLEKSDLITKLDRYIWEQAVIQLRDWHGSERDALYLSINVSPKDFYYLDIPDEMIRLCRKYEVSPAKLHVEITETAIEEQTEVLADVISRLHQNGFLVEIDDFGKGSSSLRLLKDVDADVIKIDRDFLMETENHTKSKAILTAVIDLAQKLAMEVITEGVETEKQVQSLSKMGCHKFQGFYFSKPISVKDFEDKYHN